MKEDNKPIPQPSPDSERCFCGQNALGAKFYEGGVRKAFSSEHLPQAIVEDVMTRLESARSYAYNGAMKRKSVHSAGLCSGQGGLCSLPNGLALMLGDRRHDVQHETA